MRLLTTTALLTALAATPALAQTQEAKPGDSQRQTQAQSAQSGSLQFVREQKPTDWSAEALIGRTVYNMKDEELGDINNVIVSEDGQVSAITIGAGGFLGIGEKDVGVPFSALEFRATRSDASASSGASSSGYDRQATQSGSPSQQGQAQMDSKAQPQSGSQPSQQGQAQMDSKAQPQSGSQPSQQDQAQTDSKAQPQSGMSGASRSSSTQAQSGQPDPRPRGEANLADRYDSEHENVRIYLDANKEQLENAPEFVWLSEQRDSTQGNQSGNR